MKYAVVIENARSNYSAYVPDLPGCVATARTMWKLNGKSKRQSNFTLKACGKIERKCQN
jgi:hypothetical protein